MHTEFLDRAMSLYASQGHFPDRMQVQAFLATLGDDIDFEQALDQYLPASGDLVAKGIVPENMEGYLPNAK